MPHVITQSCCSDASCVYACPVNCIHPTPDEPDFATSEMLYVDPVACVDCGACVSACPVDAIVAHPKLAPNQQRYLQINADFYREPRERPTLAPVKPAPFARRDRPTLTVAIVGSGPAAMYAADELMLTQPGVTVDIYERLEVPYGLVRHGVAPDHSKTKQVSELFDVIAAQAGVRLHLGVQIGRDLTHAELLADHHAVIYAVGASSDRRLEIPGAELAISATDFVGWYNGHPDQAGVSHDLSHRRAVVIGNGNVALDVARILTMPPSQLENTPIAPAALSALRESRIEEVVLLARRGPEQSAFTVPEFLGLLATDEVEVVLDPAVPLDSSTNDFLVRQKLSLLGELPSGHGRRIALRYFAAPSQITTEGVELTATMLEPDGRSVRLIGGSELLAAGLVLTSIGYRGSPIDGLPFEEGSGTVPNSEGRVEPGVYVTGWIKRGPSGFIGSNKSDAQQTVSSLVADYNADLLS